MADKTQPEHEDDHHQDDAESSDAEGTELDDAESIQEESKATKPKAKARSTKSSKRSKSSKRDEATKPASSAKKSEEQPSRAKSGEPKPKPSTKARSSQAPSKKHHAGHEASGSAGAGYAALGIATALFIGLGAGWLLGDAQASAAQDVGPTPSAGPAPKCEEWGEELCAQTGEKSSACSRAKSVVDLLPAGACAAALEDVEGTVERIKAARAVCDTLIARLCNDVGEDSTGCQMVKSRADSLPPSACEEMTGNYEKVLGQLKMMNRRSRRGPPGAVGPRGGARRLPKGDPAKASGEPPKPKAP